MKRKRKPTQAVKQAAEFITKARALKGIPDDCKLPSTVEAIEAGRTSRRKQLTLIDDSLMGRLRAVKARERDET